MTEDRETWYALAEAWEQEFIDKYGERFKVIINPSKSINKYAPDLYCLNSFTSADLKPVFTPFFTSTSYGIDPNYCLTFNISDLLEYAYAHDERFGLFFWVKFQSAHQYNTVIAEKEEVYYATLGELKDYLRKSGKIHEYSRRVNDTKGNAYASYLVDLRAFRKIA